MSVVNIGESSYQNVWLTSFFYCLNDNADRG